MALNTFEIERTERLPYFWTLRRHLSWKRYLLLICKILRRFVDTLISDGKYSLLNRGNLTEPIRYFYLRKKKLFQFFSAFLKSILNFAISQKKMTLIADIFPNYGLRKTWLDNCLKIPVSEDHSTSNVIKGPKECCDMNDGTFTTFIDDWEGNWVGKSLS